MYPKYDNYLLHIYNSTLASECPTLTASSGDQISVSQDAQCKYTCTNNGQNAACAGGGTTTCTCRSGICTSNTGQTGTRRQGSCLSYGVVSLLLHPIQRGFRARVG